jgi:thiol-disulfide isomerase/thioredoxin
MYSWTCRMAHEISVGFWRGRPACAARWLLAVGVCAVLLLAAPVRADEIRPLGADTFAHLKAQFAGRSFLVSLWSLDCPPCRQELVMLGELKRENPDFPLLLIATDPIEKRAEALAVLGQFGLDQIESWMFADAFTERLRFSIDPAWYGELPRSYFYAADQSMSAHSGILTRAMIDANFQVR